MKIRGAIDTEFFQFIKLSVLSCNADLQECATRAEKIKYKRVLRLYIPEPTVNFQKSDHKEAVEYALSAIHAMQISGLN